MKKGILFIVIVFYSLLIKAQTFTGTGGSIPGSSTTQTCFPVTVAGVGVINTSYGLAQVCLNITHPNDDEIEVVLTAPDGTVVPLTIQNGGTGNNYTNTCFTATATTSIKFGSAPFTGSFAAEGYLGSVNNGQNANGSWKLCIQDRRTASNAGTLSNWSLTFNNSPAPLPPSFPACTTTLPATSTCATATPVCDFNGVCGTTSGNTKQTWPELTTAACFGIDNNSFVQFIASSPTVSFSVWVPTSTGGINLGGIQMLFFSGNCNGPVTTYGCYQHIYPYTSPSIPLVTIITATGLTVGNTYYILIDGLNGATTSFRIAANTGINILNINPANPSICEGFPVNLTASGGNGVFSWSPSSGLNTTSGATVSASPTVTSIYTVTSSTSGGCPTTKDVTVTVNAAPVITTQPSVTIQNVCQNGPVNPVTVTATAGSGSISTYQWYISTNGTNVGGSLLPFANSSSFSPSTSSTGTIYFYCKITNSNGCSTISNVSGAIVISAAVATPTATATIQPTCLAPTGTIVVTAPTGANIQYSIGGAYQASGTFSSLAANTYYVTAKNIVTGCESAIKTVTVNALPPGPATPTGTVTVQPTCLIPTGTIVINSPTGVNIEYSIGGAYQSGTTFSGLTNGTTYIITAKDIITGCVSDTLMLSINTIPGAPAAPSATITTQPDCNTATGIITVTAPTGANFQYSIGGVYQVSGLFSGLIPGTTYTVTVKDISSGCISAPVNLTLNTIIPPVAPLVTSPVSFCQNAMATALSATGSNLLWYNNATGGVGSTVAPTPLTTAVGNVDFYVSQSTGTCESPRALITVSILALPSAPIITTPVVYCQNATTAVLTATGTNLLWYTTAIGGVGSNTAPIPSSTSAGSTIFYVSQNNGACESVRSAITVTINAAPGLPTVSSPVIYCQNTTATALTATGSNLLWYTNVTGGVGTSIAPTPSTIVVGSTTYYVSQSTSGCEGLRAAITITVNAAPGLPTITSPVIYCQNTTATALTATGSNLLWYTTATGGIGSSTAPTPSTIAAGNTTYYVSQTTSSCEGLRAAITVTINASPGLPTVTSPVVYCQNATATALTATGSNLLWYTNVTGGVGTSIAPTPSTIVVGSTTYYVSQSTSGCEGLRASITVTINASPGLPTVTSPVIYCQNTTAIALTATGSNLLWYTTATGGIGSSIAPTPSTIAAGSKTYYVSQSTNGCEGLRASITVTINASPGLPTVTSPVIYCQNTTAIALTATGSNLLWYTTATGGIGSSIAPTPSTIAVGSTTYYVSQSTSGCEGLRAAITVTVNASPGLPTVTSPVIYCQNTTAIALTATGSNLLWYTTATGGIGSSIAPTPSTIAVGSTTYYVSQSTSGCEGLRAAITVTVNALAASPIVISPIDYCQNTSAVQLSAIGNNLLWYAAVNGGIGSTIAPTPSTIAAGIINYYVSQTINGCEGSRAMITVNTNATPALPVVNSPVTYCQNIIAIPLSATGNNLRWYNSSTGGLGSVIAPTPLTTVAGNYNYYVSQTNSGCEGPRALITVTVIATAPAPVVISPVTYCQNAVATALSATGSNLLWYSTATGGTSSTTNPTPVTTTPGNTFYYVSQTINGCEGPRVAITVTINVISTAVTGFQFNPDTVCTNANNTTPAYALGFTNGGVFSSTTGIVINPATGFVNLATSVPGTYNITYNYTTNGCINGNSSVSPLTINAAVPTVTIFSYNSPVCKNGINPTPSKATGFTNGGNYSSRPGLSINAGTGEINLANSIPGTYQVTYNLAMLGCRLATSNFSFITITDTSSPVTNFSYNKAIVCITETNPAITKTTGFTSGGTFSATPAGLNIDAVTGAINIGLSLPGTYVVKYAVPSFICRLAGSSNFTFTINAFGNPVTGFSYASPICQNDTFKLPVKVTGFTAGGKFSSTTGLKIDSVTGIINPAQSIPGNYLIQYAVATGTCNPAGAGSANVVIQTKPISPTVNNAAICGTGNISLNASASGTIKWYSDSTLQNLVNSGSSFYPLISTNTTYYLNNTVGTCISDKTPIIATVNPLPIAPYLGKDVSICKLDPLILNAGNYFSYQWQDGSTKPNFTVTASGTYKVIVGTAAGCKISSSINIIVFDNCEDIVFPSGFSPDGNGINDKFGPLPVENLIFIKDYHLQIFNRYGELVFNSINPYEKWDGLYRGKSSGTNNFVWIASYSFRNIPKISKGNILIVK